jgi:hypothetical protein
MYTLGAKAAEYGFAVINYEPILSMGQILQIFHNIEKFSRKFRSIVIYDSAAAIAYKMGMGRHPAVKPFLPVNNPYGYHRPFPPE